MESDVVAIQDTARALRRAPLLPLSAALLIGVVASGLALTRATVIATERAVARAEATIEVRAALAFGASHTTLDSAALGAEAIGGVATVTPLTAAAALDSARTLLGTVGSTLEPGTLPPMLVITLAPDAHQPMAVARVATAVQALPGVRDVHYPSGWVERLAFIRAWRDRLALPILLWGWAGLLLSIGACAHLSVAARRTAIRAMVAAGATPRAVVGPLLAEGLMIGLGAAALATVVLAGVGQFVLRTANVLIFGTHATAWAPPVLHLMVGLGVVTAVGMAVAAAVAGWRIARAAA